MNTSVALLLALVHCRVGSLEMQVKQVHKVVCVHCRVGSLEI